MLSLIKFALSVAWFLLVVIVLLVILYFKVTG